MARIDLREVSLTSVKGNGSEAPSRRYEPMYPEANDYDLDGGTPTRAPALNLPAEGVLPSDADDARGARLQQIMGAAMEGRLARPRELHAWENDKLKAKHMQVLFMSAAGYKNKEIAEVCDLTQARVSVILRHPDSQAVLAAMVSVAAEEMLDIKARIQAHAGEMLNNVVHVTRTTVDEKLKSKNSFELLKMAGYGAVERKQVDHQLSLPKEDARALTQALSESRQLAAIPYAEFIVTEGEAGSGDGNSENSGGPVSSGEPPVVGSQTPTSRVA